MTNLDSTSAFNEAYAQETAQRMEIMFGKDVAIERAAKHVTERRQEHPAFWQRVVELIREAA